MVDKTEERQLREQQLESWGRLLAGLSHELKNHLGIIRESGGLIGDILREEAAFLQRFAKMKQVELQIETEEDVVLITSPTLLHHLIYRLFLFALEQLPVGETLTIAVKKGKNSGKICFYAGESALDMELPITEYSSALQAIAGTVSMENGQIILEFC